jgi:hypothetical protein
MQELKPVWTGLLAWHIENLESRRQIADSCRIPVFPNALRRRLLDLLRDDLSCDLIEVAARIGNFGDAREIRAHRSAVAKLLRKNGARRPRGRRSTYGLPELVAELTPFLLRFGVPLGVGEGSPLVKILREIAKEMGVSGDPRDELRRLKRTQKKTVESAKEALGEALARGLSHFAT